MALALLPVQDQITTKLNELPQAVFDNGVPDDAVLAYSDSGKLLPYIVANYSGFVQISAERGLTGPRQDLGRAAVTVSCIGPSERSARQVVDLVVDKLTGFQPTDAGILEPQSSGRAFVIYDANSRPVKYVAEVTFIFVVNTVVS